MRELILLSKYLIFSLRVSKNPSSVIKLITTSAALIAKGLPPKVLP